jgi:hypothetical protein
MRYLRRPIACLLSIWYLPACATYTYEPTHLEPAQAIADQKEVRVTIQEDDSTARRLRVKDPWVRNDSLGGTPCFKFTAAWNEDRGERCAVDSLAVPLQSVVEIETKVRDDTGDEVNSDTALKVFLIAGTIVLAATAAIMGVQQ